MLVPVRSGQFRRDVKRAEKRGKDLRKLRELLELLIGAAYSSPASRRTVTQTRCVSLSGAVQPLLPKLHSRIEGAAGGIEMVKTGVTQRNSGRLSLTEIRRAVSICC